MLKTTSKALGLALLWALYAAAPEQADAAPGSQHCWTETRYRTVDTVAAAGNGVSVAASVQRDTIAYTVPICGSGNLAAPTPRKWTAAEYRAFMIAAGECRNTSMGMEGNCTLPSVQPGESADPIDRDLVESYARELALSLTLPEPDINVGPDPSVNKWDMAVVGFPLWIWTTEESNISNDLTEGGITIELSATRDSTTFDFGDDTTLTCTRMSPLPRGYDAGDPSPTCGHIYEYPSLPDGNYTITATAHWTFHWSALGYSGTLPGTTTTTRELPVGELQAVLIPTKD